MEILDLVKIKKSVVKSTVKRIIEKQIQDWEEICASHISEKGHISKIWKELSKLNSKKTKHLN